MVENLSWYEEHTLPTQIPSLVISEPVSQGLIKGELTKGSKGALVSSAHHFCAVIGTGMTMALITKFI